MESMLFNGETAKILNGQSVSGKINGGSALAGVSVPASFVGDGLYYEVETPPGSGTFQPLLDELGVRYVTKVAAGSYTKINAVDFLGIKSFRVTSVTGSAPANQSADRQLAFTLVP